MRTAAFTAAALVGFAANSLLCRLALGEQAIDAASFTAVRLVSGAVVLALLARRVGKDGSWRGAAALFLYAIAFSFAYRRLGASTGALVLFGTVQATMIGWSFAARGERPGALEWVGLVLALAGLVALVLPGLAAPDPLGAGLMAVAGVAWGAYSLLGRGSTEPLATTADNFVRSVPFALVAALVAWPAGLRAEPRGLALAALSGALASGVGYALWYAALPSLTATRAAVVQLSVPVLAAAGAALWLGESPTARLAGAGGAILGGVALALLGKRST